MKSNKSTSTSRTKSNKWYLVVIGILAIAIFYFMISSILQTKRQRQELADTREQAEQIMAVNAQTQLSLMMKTFVWAVRSSQIRDNLDEVNQYFYELVKEKNIREIILADNQGTILVATNKIHERKPFTDLFSGEFLQVNDVSFTRQDSFYYVASPVMSLNNRLGTLFLQYKAPKMKFD